MDALPADADRILAAVGARRIVLAGPTGAGKSTLARAIADRTGCWVVAADPGRPELGPPGAVSRGIRRDGAWVVEAVEGLATLDAARFRLPLVQAVRRLCEPAGACVVDAPGVDRGMAVGELLPALIEAARAEVALWFGDEPPVDLAATVPTICVAPSVAARPLAHPERLSVRTERWDAWLAGARTYDLSELPVVGAPPPDVALRVGRQVVIRDHGGNTLAIGEITAPGLRFRAPPFDAALAAHAVVRDAMRHDGQLRTAPAPTPPRPARDLRGPLQLPGASAAATRLQATLLGGVLGDPSLQLRWIGEPRSILADLGEVPLSATLAHHVALVLISHAHLDHFGGFARLVRRRVGFPAPVTVLGPAGLARHVDAVLRSITWDRVGALAPAFRVGEILPGGAGPAVVWTELRAGEPPVSRGAEPVAGGVVHREPEVTIRAATLEHGIPVVAWAIEEPLQVRIRRDGLRELGLAPGRWLGRFRLALQQGDRDAPIALPDGSIQPARALESALALWQRGRRIVYATDLADSPTNRERLVALARGADVLVCEATFLEEDVDRARRTGHLTARACGEIAAAADVGLLVPFHVSARYPGRLDEVYREVEAAFPRVWRP